MSKVSQMSQAESRRECLARLYQIAGKGSELLSMSDSFIEDKLVPSGGVRIPAASAEAPTAEQNDAIQAKKPSKEKKKKFRNKCLQI